MTEPLQHVAAAAVGGALVLVVIVSAVRALVLPRAAPTLINRFVFAVTSAVLGVVAGPWRPWKQREQALAYFAPLSLLLLPLVWLVLAVSGFTLMLWSLGVEPLREAFITAGSSVLTLGFARPPNLPATLATFAAGGLGLGLVGLLISYLPTIYSAFSRRETAVALLEGLAGSPPTAEELLLRHHRIGGLDRLNELWEAWPIWFADVEESHASVPALCYLRSPRPDHSWITAAGCVLDTASLYLAALDLEDSGARAALCVRSGFLCLRHVAESVSIPFDPDPAPDDPISIERAEFDSTLDRLGEAGLPIKADRDQAWKDFAGWRVNYEAALLGLAGLIRAPSATWSSDRSHLQRRQSISRPSAPASPPRRRGGRSRRSPLR